MFINIFLNFVINFYFLRGIDNLLDAESEAIQRSMLHQNKEIEIKELSRLRMLHMLQIEEPYGKTSQT